MRRSELFNDNFDLDSYLETHFEIVSYILRELEKDDSTNFVHTVFSKRGTGGMYELAKYLTDQFEEKHKDTNWDGDYFDELELFLQEQSLFDTKN